MRRFIYFAFSLLALCAICSTRALADDDLTGKSPVTTLTDGGYYYIVNNQDAFYTTKGKHVAFYYDEADAGNLYWNQISTSDVNFVFQLVKKSDNVWTIRNCASNQYVRGAAFEMLTFGFGEYEQTFYPQDNGYSFKIGNTSTSRRLYTDNSGYGSNKKGKVGCNSYSTGALASYADWNFYEVDATTAAAAEAVGATNAATFVTEIEDGGYYYIVNDYKKLQDKPYVEVAMWYEPNHMYWKQLDFTDYNYIFKATKDANGKIALQNVLSHKYAAMGTWVDDPYYHTITDAADASFAPYLGAGTGLFNIMTTEGTGNPLGMGCLVCSNTRYGEIGQEDHCMDASSYNSVEKGYNNRWKFYKVPQNKIDALLYGIPVTDLSQLSDDKYYYIISQHDDFRHLDGGHSAAQTYNGYEGALGYSDNVTGYVAWISVQRSNPDPAAVWKIKKDGDYYQLQNVYTGKYAGEAAANKVSWTDECEKTQKFGESTIAGAFKISNSNHTYWWGISGAYHNNPYGEVGSVSGMTEARQSWKIYELTDAQIQGLCNVLTQELQAAVNSGVGIVTGIKDETSMAAAQALLAATPDYDALKNALDDYVMNLTTGYWRIQNENGSKEYMTVKPAHTFNTTAHDIAPYDYVMCDALGDGIKSDYSTVWTITDKGDGTYTMASQGLYHANKYAMAHPNMAVALQNQSMKYGAYNGTGKVWIQVSKEDGTWTSHPYIMKNPSNSDKRVNCYYTIGGGEATLKWTIYPATDITIALHKVGDNHWATLYVPFGVTLPEGTEAFVGAVDGDVLRLTSIGQDIPAATPVVIVGNATNITATINDEIAAYTGTNALSGQYLAASSRDDNIRSLGVKDGVIGFYKLPTASTGLGANKAFLNMSSGSRGLKVVLDDDVTAVNTAIVNDQSSMVNDYYDLQGRKVVAPQKGSLYIKDGKVVKF